MKNRVLMLTRCIVSLRDLLAQPPAESSHVNMVCWHPACSRKPFSFSNTAQKCHRKRKERWRKIGTHATVTQFTNTYLAAPWAPSCLRCLQKYESKKPTSSITSAESSQPGVFHLLPLNIQMSECHVTECRIGDMHSNRVWWHIALNCLKKMKIFYKTRQTNQLCFVGGLLSRSHKQGRSVNVCR